MWLSLTDMNGDEVLVNTDQIAYFQTDKYYTDIIFVGSNVWVRVRELMDEIRERL